MLGTKKDAGREEMGRQKMRGENTVPRTGDVSAESENLTLHG